MINDASYTEDMHLLTDTAQSALTETPSRAQAPHPLIQQIFLYCLVGGVCTLVDMTGFFFTNTFLSWHYFTAILAGRIAGASTNYFLNKTVTFRSKCEQTHLQVGAFIIVALTSFFMSEGLMYLFVDILKIGGYVYFHQHRFNLCYVLTTFIMLPVNYLMQRFIVFNQKLIK